MLDAMRWLVRSARPDDSLFFHCEHINYRPCTCLTMAVDSGHGGQTPDLDGDELDGLDEGYLSRFTSLMVANNTQVIFPVDFKKNGHIVDDVRCLLCLCTSE